jgi:spore coat protein U-like protein
MRKILYTIGLAALMSSAALATDLSHADLGVSASISNNCTIVTAPVQLGTYNPLNGAQAKDGTGSVTVRCTFGFAGAYVTLNGGLHESGGPSTTAPARQLSDGTSTPNFLSYTLYSANDHATIWAGGVNTNPVSTGTGTDQVLTVYGTIASGQNTAPAGSYADTVVATVSF